MCSVLRLAISQRCADGGWQGRIRHYTSITEANIVYLCLLILAVKCFTSQVNVVVLCSAFVLTPNMDNVFVNMNKHLWFSSCAPKMAVSQLQGCQNSQYLKNSLMSPRMQDSNSHN